MSNPVTYAYSTWQPDAAGADSGHPITQTDPMGAGTSNDAAGWVRLLESQMRRRSSVACQWEEWLGINTPYSPSPNAPVYIAGNQFRLTGDWTVASAGFYSPIAVVGRRVQAFTNGSPSPNGILGTITAATVAAGATTVTVAWDSAASIDSSLTEVQFGIPTPGVAIIPSVSLYKANLQAITGSATPDTSLIFTMAAQDRWMAKFVLFLNWTIGSGGNFTVTVSGPSGATYNMGVSTSGLAASSGSSPSITFSSTNNVIEVLLFAACGSTPGSVTLQYQESAGPSQVLAGSFMTAQRVTGA